MKFIYLVQGQAHLVSNFFYLKEKTNVQAFFLTYDKEIDGATYLPNSTWAEGRNELLENALKLGGYYDYIIFVDDDAHFYLGSWGQFESELESYRPAIGVPVFDRTLSKVLPYPLFTAQLFTFHDEQIMAFSKKVVDENIVLPYQTQFDELHWWATCRVQQILIHNIYASKSLQFNTVRVLNLEHDRYDVKSNSEDSYIEHVLSWIHTNYSLVYKDVNKTPSKVTLFVKTVAAVIRNSHWRGIISIRNISRTLRNFEKQNVNINLSEITTLMKPKEQWVLYGFGQIGQAIYNYVSNDSVIGFCSVVDKVAINKEYKHGVVKVLSPESLLNNNEVKVLVASIEYKDEIKAYLRHRIGLKTEQIYYLKSIDIPMRGYL